MKGRGGLNGWQWIFIMEGIITIALGVLSWLYIPDFPDKSKFLNESERKVGSLLSLTLPRLINLTYAQMILDRVEADRGDSVPDEMTRAKFFKHLFDPLVWAFGKVV